MSAAQEKMLRGSAYASFLQRAGLREVPELAAPRRKGREKGRDFLVVFSVDALRHDQRSFEQLLRPCKVLMSRVPRLKVRNLASVSVMCDFRGLILG